MKKHEIDWQKFLNYNMEQQNIAEFTKQMAELTGRELYESEMMSLSPKYLIDTPVNYAFHRTQINYPVEPVDVMRDCLIDGHVFIRVEDANHIRIEEYVSRAEWSDYDETLNFIEIKYVYTEVNKEDFYHVEHYRRNPDGTATWIVFKPVSPNAPESEWVVAYTIELPIFPYVGIRWVFNQSFLTPLKRAIIALERAYVVIGAENIERMGLQLYIQNIKNIEDIQTAPRKMGRRVHILPKDATFHSPASDAPGMELMLVEITNLQQAIERASGVVAPMQLALLSGKSREMAEKPLIILADELRNRFTKGMLEVVELSRLTGGAPELKLSYRPLKYIEDKNSYIAILDKARELNNTDPSLGISLDEYSKELRLLLDMNPEITS